MYAVTRTPDAAAQQHPHALDPALHAALVAAVGDAHVLTDATAEALHYLDQALDHGFRPGMGRAVADRLFWAESDDDDGDAPDDTPATLPFPDPFNETKH